MADIIKTRAEDGSIVEFDNRIIGSGAMKDVYFTTDKSHVVAFYRNPLDASGQDRIRNITGDYRESIFTPPYGDYWKRLFCWPEKIVNWNGHTGLLCPAYDKDFFFTEGRFAGKEKEGKWFASARLRNKFLEANQKGDWLKHLQICLNLARAVRRLHAAGLSHSDLSYKNVLVDPLSGRACIIDIDGLVVGGKYAPDVVGTPDFIAPEVMATHSLPPGDPARALPGISTDRHALAVLIYMYLLYRHPLRGPLVHDLDPARDEELSMGKLALFIENNADPRNRPRRANLDRFELPDADVDSLPYTICGPYLSRLFEQAFMDGLHNPEERPAAADWEDALIKTIDLIQPCQNPQCASKWFVFDNSRKPECPFCHTRYTNSLPVLNMYCSPKPGIYKSENRRLMVYHGQSLYKWHVSQYITPNEKINAIDKKPVGDFHFHKGRWILVNRSLPDMWDKNENVRIEPGNAVALEEGKRILLSSEPGGRLLLTQLVNN